MWLLQRKNLHKKHLLWLKIVGLCLSLHVIVLLWVFCIYRENKYMYAFAVNKKIDYSIPIVFKPYSAKASDFAKASSDRPMDEPLKEQSKPKAKVGAPKPVTVTKPIKKEAEKATTITEPLKKIVEPAKKVVPIEAVKPIEQQKVESVQKTEPKKEVAPIAAEKKLEPDHTKATSDMTSDAAKTMPTAHVSNNYREVEAMRRGAQLQKELVQQWHPPIGVSPDCSCEISFFVDKQGTIQNLKMVKGSGVMMFDISARQALFAMKMPQWTYGKPLIISFKQ